VQGFQYVTRLQQYSFLLSVALGRLYSLLKIPGNIQSYECGNECRSVFFLMLF
jgi:hypothetical protein